MLPPGSETGTQGADDTEAKKEVQEMSFVNEDSN
jgi:hypothetical protein